MNQGESDAWQQALRSVIAPYLLSRLWCAIFVYWGHANHPYLIAYTGGWEGVSHWWLNAWTSFDSKYFIDIAAHGYNAGSAAFFPLYPFVLKLAGTDPIAIAAWGIVVSNAAFLSGLLVFYRLTEWEYSAPIAEKATWLLAFFPTCVIFSAVYTESLFLLLVVSTFWCVRRNRWFWAAAFAFLAALTRNVGPVLFLAFAAGWITYNRSTPARQKWPSLGVVFAPLLGFLVVQLYFQQKLGIWMASVAAQNSFQGGSRHINWPWQPLAHDIAALFAPGGLNLLYLLSIATCLLAFVLCARHYKTQPASYSVFLLGVLMLHLIFTTGRDAQTVDAMRYMSTTFPFMQWLALDLQFISANRIRRAIGLAMLLLVSAIFAYSFGIKTYVS